MSFAWRVFSLAKEPEHPEQNQDAWWVDPDRGAAAIADGVTSGIFSGQWAQILTRASVADWPDPAEPSRFASWLGEQRRRWNEQIDTSGLAWYQRAKLREGGFTTLVWMRIAADSAGGETFRLEALAIGDSCLFHIRGDEMLASFPIGASLQFDSSPLVLGSVDLHRDGQLQFERFEAQCRNGDLVVLCSDAVAAWALDCREKGEAIAWSDYWEMPVEAWIEEVRALRSQGRMRYDDATLMLLRVGPAAATAAQRDSDEVVLESAADDFLFPAPAPAGENLAVAPAGPIAAPAEEETYELAAGYDLAPPAASPAGSPAANGPAPVGPPPLPAFLGKKTLPPPPGGSRPAGPPDWRDAVNAFSERLLKKVSEKLSEGVDKLQEVKDAAVQKYYDKKRGKPADDRPEPPADRDS